MPIITGVSLDDRLRAERVRAEVLNGTYDVKPMVREYDPDKGEFPAWSREMVPDALYVTRNPAWMHMITDMYINHSNKPPSSKCLQVLRTQKRVREMSEKVLMKPGLSQETDYDWLGNCQTYCDRNKKHMMGEIEQRWLREMRDTPLTDYLKGNMGYCPFTMQSEPAGMQVEWLTMIFAINDIDLPNMSMMSIVLAMNQILKLAKVKIKVPRKNLPNVRDPPHSWTPAELWHEKIDILEMIDEEVEQWEFRALAFTNGAATKKYEFRSASGRYFQLQPPFQKIAIWALERVAHYRMLLLNPQSSLLLKGGEKSEEFLLSKMNSHETIEAQAQAKKVANLSCDITKYNEGLTREMIMKEIYEFALNNFGMKISKELVRICCGIARHFYMELAPINLYDKQGKKFKELLSNLTYNHFGLRFIQDVGLRQLAAAHCQAVRWRGHMIQKYNIDPGDVMKSLDLMGMGLMTKMACSIQNNNNEFCLDMFGQKYGFIASSSDDQVARGPPSMFDMFFAANCAVGLNPSAPKTIVTYGDSLEVVGIYIYRGHLENWHYKECRNLKPAKVSFEAMSNLQRQGVAKVTQRSGFFAGICASHVINLDRKFFYGLGEDVKGQNIMSNMAFGRQMGCENKYTVTYPFPIFDPLNIKKNGAQNLYAINKDADALRQEIGVSADYSITGDNLVSASQFSNSLEDDFFTLGSAMNLPPPSAVKENLRVGRMKNQSAMQSLRMAFLKRINPKLTISSPVETVKNSLEDAARKDPYFKELWERAQGNNIMLDPKKEAEKRMTYLLNKSIKDRKRKKEAAEDKRRTKNKKRAREGRKFRAYIPSN